jgi:putative tricarboxylic transport membrane protein
MQKHPEKTMGGMKMKHVSLTPLAGKCLRLVPVVGALLFSPLADAQEGLPPGYPSKPIELVIPFAPGGGVDLFGRTVARILTEEKIVPQHIQVTNLPGAGGALGVAAMAKRKDDPYSLLGIAIHILVTPIMLGTPNTYKDVTPLAKLFADYQMVVVPTDSPIKSLKEVADTLKKDPASLRIGGASLGSGDHLSISRIAQSLGIDPAQLTYIAYSGGEANAAILGGHVDIGLGGLDLIDLVKGGKMRALGISAPKRLSGDFAAVPTFVEQGYNVVNENWRGIFAPPGQSPAVVKYWQDALTKMVQTDAWKKELENHQWVAAFETDAFPATLAKDDAMYRDLLQKLNLVK